MHKCGDIVTVYMDGFDRPWKGTGVITEVDDDLILVRFNKRTEWWYEEKHLHESSMDDLKEALVEALIGDKTYV